jgi:hypothetical protein
MQYTFFGSKHRSNVQGNEENSINIASQASIVEVPDFEDHAIGNILLFF